jgi:hypothetical protein
MKCYINFIALLVAILISEIYITIVVDGNSNCRIYDNCLLWGGKPFFCFFSLYIFISHPQYLFFFSMIPNQRELALRNSSNLLVINTIRLDPKFPDLGSHYCCIV